MDSLCDETKHLPKPKYLTVADSELKSIVTPVDFERSLLLNILFQLEVLIPDAFCFGEPIRKHVTSYTVGPSLFEAAINCGAMRIAFRNQDAVSFPQLLEAIRDSGIRITVSDKAKAEQDIVAYRLKRATEDPGSKFTPAYWPSHSVGDAFAKRTEAFLAYEKMPDIDPSFGIDTFLSMEEFRRLWEETRKWRIDAIGKALEQTKKIEGAGLRRSEILKAVGEILNVPKASMERTDLLIDLLPFASEEDRPALERFHRWVVYLQNLNFADQFDAIPNFPDYEPLDAVIGMRAIRSGLLSASLPSNLSIHRLVLAVQIPRLQTLLTMRPTHLLRIRDDLGHRYLAAVDSWQHEPGAKQEQEVNDALQCYAHELVKWAAHERDSGLTTLRVEYIRELSSTRGVLAKATQLASSVAKPVKEVVPTAISAGGSVGSLLLTPLVGPVAALLNLGIKSGLVIYRLLRPCSEREHIELATYEAPPTARTVVEVDLPPRAQDDSTASV